MEPLRVRMFGGLSLAVGDDPLPPIASRTGRSLLGYLVAHRQTAPARDLLAGVFWPELSEAQARRRLSHALWQIQSVLGEAGRAEQHLDVRPTSIRFIAGPHTWIDVDEFESTLDEVKADGPTDLDPRAETLDRLVGAVKLYRGDFLAGFYDDWVVLEQERLRQLLSTALTQVVRLSKSWGDFTQALQYARRLALLEPLHEEAHREVMRLCYLLGKPNEALQQYERCASILAAELGAEPDSETVALRQEVASGRHSPIVAFPEASRAQLFGADQTPIIGRDAERREIVAGMEEALAGRGGLVLIEGEPGIGKTRLLEACAEDANWRGLNVLWGASRPDGLPRPFDAIRQALNDGLTELRARQLVERMDDVWLRTLAPLLPALGRWAPVEPAPSSLRSGAEERQRLGAALHRTFVALGQLTPTMLVLDDVHDADEDTLWALQSLTTSLSQMPLLICVAYRRAECERSGRWDAITELDQADRRTRLVLGPLGAAETAELVRRLTPESGGTDFATGLHGETGGNPLFVLETLRAVHQHQVAEALKPPASVAATDPGQLPVSGTVRDILAKRLSALPGAARRVAAALAVGSLSVDIDTLAEVAGIPRIQTLESVDELVAAGMVATRHGGYTLSHEQLARVAYELCPADERRSLHRRLAGYLEQSGSEDDSVLGYHFKRGGATGTAAAYLERAADTAVGLGAYGTARHQYEQALEQATAAGWEPREQARIRLSLEQVLDVLGDRAGQARILGELEPLVDPHPARSGPLAAEVLRRRARLLGSTARLDEAAQACRSALAIDEELGSKTGQAQDLLTLGRIEFWGSEHERALDSLEKALELIEPGSVTEADIRHALSDAHVEMSAFAAARTELATAEHIYERHGDMRGLAAALGSKGVLFGSLNDELNCERAFLRAVEVCDQIGYRYGSAINKLNLGTSYVVFGRAAHALPHLREARTIFRAISDERGRALAAANLAHLALYVGDDSWGEGAAREALEIFSAIGHQPSAASCLGTLAELARRRDDAEEAGRLVDQGLARARGPGGTAARIQLERTRAHLMLDRGRLEEGLRHAEAGIAEAQAAGQQWLIRDLQVPLARAAVLLGLPERALAATVGVDHCAQETELLYWRMRAHELTGDLPATIEALERAHAALQRALAGLPPEQSSDAISNVSLYRELTGRWRRSRPRTTTVRLAGTGAPTGRPVRPEELVELEWTIEHPLDVSVPDGPLRRRHRLARLADEAAAASAAPTVPDLASALETSQATIRRDLKALRDAGRRIPTRGRR